MKRLLLTFTFLALFFSYSHAQAVTGSAKRIITGATLPATCNIGDVYYKTGTSAGFKVCTAANTWTSNSPGAQVAGTVTFSSTTTTVNFATGSIQTLTLTGNIATQITASNIPTGDVTLIIKQDSTGSRTIAAWNSLFLFAGGTKPTFTTTANATDMLKFTCNGTNCLLSSAIYDLK